MKLEDLLTDKKEEKTELSFLIVNEDRFYISLVKYFPYITPISEIIKYKQSDVVILTKEGNLEFYPISYADRIEPIIRDYEKHEFEEHYKEQDTSSCFMTPPNLCKIYVISNTVWDFRENYKREFERIFREYNKITTIESLWNK